MKKAVKVFDIDISFDEISIRFNESLFLNGMLAESETRVNHQGKFYCSYASYEG